jgi:hypothetical protein
LVPFAFVNRNQYQIIALTDRTIIKAADAQYQLNAGQYLQISVTGTAILTASFPVQLVQLGQVGSLSQYR